MTTEPHADAFRAVSELARTLGRAPSVHEYQAHRTEVAPGLPATTTIYRAHGSWHAFLDAAGVEPAPGARTRGSTDAMLDAMCQVALALGRDDISSHAYDDYRHRHALPLPSSSAIRKRLGSWGQALSAAGLESPARGGTRLSPGAALAALQRAITLHTGEGAFDQAAYEEVVAREPGSWPSVGQIAAFFPSWAEAVRAVRGEADDDLPPRGLWTRQELRRLVGQLESLDPVLLQASHYERLRRRSRRILPEWPVLQAYLEETGRTSTDRPRRTA